MESPTIAPIEAARATPQMLIVPVAASSDALINVISPGSGMPMLSARMIAPTTRRIISGGRVPSHSSIPSIEPPLGSRAPYDEGPTSGSMAGSSSWTWWPRVGDGLENARVDQAHLGGGPAVGRVG